jgi:hypothetical protein
MDQNKTIRFKGKVTIDVFYGEGEEDYDPTDFFPNEFHDVTILEMNKNTADIEFGDGTVAFNVPVKLFESVEK